MSDILTGDCLDIVRTLAGNSVDCIITYPPYWALRDYGVDGQLGSEETPEEYIRNLVTLFREAKRVLKERGTFWLNLGDTYNANSGLGFNGNAKMPDTARSTRIRSYKALPAKNLLGMPWRVALALQSDGWYLRQDIVWSKPNPMPESVKDRFTKSHEYIFLLTKSSSYYFDQTSVLEPASPNTHARMSQDIQNQIGSLRANGGSRSGRPMKAVSRKHDPGDGNKNNPSFDAAMAVMPEKRNKRSVWQIPTQPFKEAHFATFPENLVVPMVLAGCPERGTVLDPFFGAGTVGVVAKRLNRQYIGIELNPKYVEIAEKRLMQEALL